MKSMIVKSAVFGCTLAALFAANPSEARPTRANSGAKYVFFFLGDGMSASQIQATEAWLTTANGGSARNAEDLLNPGNRLNMTKLPIAGMQTTFDAGALMTDSASSATAFSCGIKTLSGVINMDTTKTISYKSIAQLAHEMGMSVGVLSSVSLDHATPAAYYASVPSRGAMNDICTQLANSGYEFFGGGSMAKGGASFGTDAWALAASNGYSVVSGRDAILGLIDNPQTKVICPNAWLQDSSAMPYHVDFDAPEAADNVTLAEMTETAIACLKDDKDGFFIMVEGGKIDWACHANDAMAAIGDMIDFDNAIGEAITFYLAHPNDTLIVVTGDHETGGLTIGHATTGYSENYAGLTNQTCSFTYFGANQLAAHKAAYADSYTDTPSNLVSNADMLNLMEDCFGLVYADLNDYQKEKLEAAYDKSMMGSNNNSSAENNYLYSYYEPIVVTITHILNERASIGWTSYSHTGIPVPVFAAGFDAYRFAGFYDNTDIAKQIAAAMRYKGTLPVERD